MNANHAANLAELAADAFRALAPRLNVTGAAEVRELANLRTEAAGAIERYAASVDVAELAAATIIVADTVRGAPNWLNATVLGRWAADLDTWAMAVSPA